MFEITVSREFCAAHALLIHGEREPVHGHNWRISASIAGSDLDADGLLIDFHWLERKLDAIIGPFDNADLNAIPPFDQINPTAEQVARHIGDALRDVLPKSVHLISASVMEAPGCIATYRPRVT